MSVLGALDEALRHVKTEPADGAAVELARSLASFVDEAESGQVATAAARLTEVLRELGMTPRARSGVVGTGQETPTDASGKLDELQRRRRARAD